VKTTVYVVGEEAEAMKTVWRAVQRSELATAPSTLVGIASLGYAGQLVEIEAIAVMGDGGTSAPPSRMRP
jgi:enamine deaminase RidA (YjgF/YER057c/UK114 family)